MSKIREDTKKTADLLENLNSIVDQKDKDLDRFKKGYDLVRLRSFVLNVVEAISFLQNRKSEFTDEKFASYVNAYEKQLLRILDDLGIQSFVPKVGDIATDVEGIEVIGATPLAEGGKPNGVSEILSQGFIMNFQDGRKEILKTAQVNVYK
jgi:molecular chaperone GrpE (heat shock protein)